MLKIKESGIIRNILFLSLRTAQFGMFKNMLVMFLRIDLDSYES